MSGDGDQGQEGGSLYFVVPYRRGEGSGVMLGLGSQGRCMVRFVGNVNSKQNDRYD